VRDLERAVARGELRRVRRNQYLDGGMWDDLWPESRHLAEVLAVVDEMRGGAGVVSHASAAALRGLPLYRHRPSHVHLTIAADVGSSTASGVRRHRDAIGPGDIEMVDGIRCTTLERTVFDVARTTPAETALACADAALRAVAVPDGFVQDAVAADAWRARMRERALDAPGMRGVRRARATIELADGRAHLPGESITRLQLTRLGFSAPRTQVRVASPNGGDYWVDLAIDDARTFIEFDGKGKYLDAATRGGVSLEAVLLEEKQREDWIRGRTGWGMVRVSDEHVRTPADLAARLAAFGIHSPRAF